MAKKKQDANYREFSATMPKILWATGTVFLLYLVALALLITGVLSVQSILWIWPLFALPLFFVTIVWPLKVSEGQTWPEALRLGLKITLAICLIYGLQFLRMLLFTG